ncbi:AMP-dependent synthetase/ligase [Hornefia butyriciproducens]|uniref:AMP-dependent synthetase/ligase n=1 Tax=Hornefia butyriciproducens TaxID=2652293 RepID=UPI002A909A4D|nr:AMP-binding protein [Hornefia butyriciproducens]MDY5463281.1 AMP-binding protein [Hornefia butyriciproducens]
MTYENAVRIPQLSPVYRTVEHRDFRELLQYAADTYGDDCAFILKEKRATKTSPAEYRRISFRELKRDVDAFGTGLLKSGLAGKRFAIIGKNRYEWIVSYYAVLCGLGICVPLDKGLPCEELVSSLERSRCDVLIFDRDHSSLVRQAAETGELSVETFICMDESDSSEPFRWILDKGYLALENGDTEYSRLPVDPQAMSIILFTSGTTNLSKAVMLNQRNILSNIYAMLQVEDIRRGDVNMAFLPYHHTFGSTGQTLMIAAGVTTAFCDGLKYIQKNIAEYHVSVFVCVPLLIEAMYKKIINGIHKQEKDKVFRRGLRISGILRRLHIDRRRRIFSDIIEQLGGSLRFIISGASPLDPAAARGFDAVGINVVQGYGMTEASPVLAAENPGNRRPGSIGKAMPGVDLRIIDTDAEGVGELVARGPNIMTGYYHNPEETAATLTDGWLHTGDLASVDRDGFLYIRGRKKNVIVLKNGKNVYPEEIELRISDFPYVRENMVYGEPRHRDSNDKDLALCAKIVYDKAYFRDHFGTWDPDKIQTLIHRDIDKMNDELPNYKHILRLTVTDQEMAKTTTGKVKRYIESKSGSMV